MQRTLYFLVVVSALLCFSLAEVNAAFPVPAPPDWWQVPPDGMTRLQHHSFHADPNLNQPPDSTYDGFIPSQPDQWTLPQNIQYNTQNPTPWGVYWEGGPINPFLNDNIGATLDGPGTLTKRMGNLRNEDMIKEFYALIIWSGPAGALSVNVCSEPDTTVTTDFTFENGEACMWGTVVQGTIIPQPDWEDFSFSFNTGVFVDEVYIGTYCVPEPASLLILALGGIAMMRRKRR